MSATHIGAVVATGVWLFYALRELFGHSWKGFWAMRAVFASSMVALAAAGVIFLIQEEAVAALVFLAVVFVGTEVGERAILQEMQEEAPPEEAQGSIRDLVVKAAAAAVSFVLAAIALFG